MKKAQLSKGVHIFIDGPDGCSKTTIAKMLSAKTGFPITKMPHAQKHFKDGSVEAMSYIYNMTIAQFSRYNFIVDRGFISSLVYSNVYDRKTDLDYTRKIMEELDPLIIILTATDAELFRRRPSDAVIAKTQRVKVRREYERIAKSIGLPLINTSKKTKGQVLELVLSKIKERYGTKF